VPGRVLANARCRCSVHTRLPVDAATGHALCRSCIAGKEVAWQVVALWPPDVEVFLRACGKASGPEHDPTCGAVAAPPKFVTPEPGKRYEGPDPRIAVRVFSPAERFYYFLDGLLIAEGGRDIAMPVSAGRHSLACVDANGSSAQVEFEWGE